MCIFFVLIDSVLVDLDGDLLSFVIEEEWVVVVKVVFEGLVFDWGGDMECIVKIYLGMLVVWEGDFVMVWLQWEVGFDGFFDIVFVVLVQMNFLSFD